MRMLGSVDAASEATQDVLIRIFRGLKNFRGDSSLESWIYRITINVCLSYKSRWRLPTISIEDAEAIQSIIDEDSNPETMYIQEESRERLAGLISRLGEKESEAVNLYYVDGMTYDETRAVMDIPIGSVATLLNRGRAHLHVLVLREKEEL